MVAPLIGLLGLTGASLLAGQGLIQGHKRYEGSRLKGILEDLPEDASTDQKLAAMAGAGLLDPEKFAQIGFGDAQSGREFQEDTALTRLQYDMAGANQLRTQAAQDAAQWQRMQNQQQHEMTLKDRDRELNILEQRNAIEMAAGQAVDGLNSQAQAFNRALELGDQIEGARMIPGAFTPSQIRAAEQELHQLETGLFQSWLRENYGDAEPTDRTRREFLDAYPTFTLGKAWGIIPGRGARNFEAVREGYRTRIDQTQGRVGQILDQTQKQIERLTNPNTGITTTVLPPPSRGGGIAPGEITPDPNSAANQSGRFSSKNMSQPAVDALTRLEQAYGQQLTVTSAYRDPEHNRRVGGARGSQHQFGNAFDFDVSDLSRTERAQLIRLAREAGFKGVGVYENSLHFDVGPQRAWGPNYRRGSLPEWAKPYVQ